jgi:Putative beta barrel porin-7 (BBP7)
MRSRTILRTVLVVAVLLMASPFAVAQDVAGPTVYGRAEFLRWTIQDAPMPSALLSTTNAGGGQSDVLIGGQPVGMGTLPGGRFNGGIWFDPAVGVEAGGFFLDRASRFDLFTDDTGGLRFGQPYINALTGLPALRLLSGIGLLTPSRTFFLPDSERQVTIPGINLPGSTAVVGFANRSTLWGTDVNGMYGVGAGGFRAEFLAGVRYLQLDEQMVLEAASFQAPAVAGDLFTTTDSFTTRNEFFGGQAGVRFVYAGVGGFLEVRGKFAAGTMLEQVDIAGALKTTTFDSTRPPALYAGGMYAQHSNIGTTNVTRFATLSEAQVNGGFQFGPVRAFAGYSILYVSSVARPGNQIDPAINPSQSEAITKSGTPPGIGNGPAFPARSVNSSSFWAQGVNFGLELRY